ncbi:hypothetical protein F5B21DRAFT_475157 [Xylaria acuta]|nr:hypothetical protein F5B21DRAFT_475157 [Xylaria acuta]
MASNQHPLHGGAPNEKLWPRNKHHLKVRFLNGDDWQKNLVRYVVWKYYHEIPMRIGFEFLKTGTPGPSDIRVEFSTESRSYIGRDAEAHPEETTLWLNLNNNIGDDRERRLQWQADILHEFGHAPGTEHEHSHPDCKLSWNYRVLQGRTGWDATRVHYNYDKIYSANAKLAPYDPESIIHYCVYEGDTPGMGTTIPLNTTLLDGDKKFLVAIYPVEKPKPPTDLVQPRKRKFDEKPEKYRREMIRLEQNWNRHHDHGYGVTMSESTMIGGSNNNCNVVSVNSGSGAFIGINSW